FYRSLRIVADDLECELIPIDTRWAGYLQDHHLQSWDLVLPDARYPNDKGHQVVAKSVMSSLNRIIEHLP
ncbi:MAG: hypothetical protein R6W75_10645, partial [Smithellaceae bacterium]